MEFSKHFRSRVNATSPDWTCYEDTAHAMRASYLGELAASARRGAAALVRVALAKRRSKEEDEGHRLMRPVERADEPINRWIGGNGGL